MQRQFFRAPEYLSPIGARQEQAPRCPALTRLRYPGCRPSTNPLQPLTQPNRDAPHPSRMAPHKKADSLAPRSADGRHDRDSPDLRPVRRAMVSLRSLSHGPMSLIGAWHGGALTESGGRAAQNGKSLLDVYCAILADVVHAYRGSDPIRREDKTNPHEPARPAMGALQ